MINVVIMAGGSGTRLWPLSRSAYPKQFVSLFDDETMLQNTCKRMGNLDVNSFMTICNNEHRFFVAEQLREINQPSSIILEPAGRNTAPAIALAAFLSPDDESQLLLILPADHIIKDNIAFTNVIKSAIPAAMAGRLVTFGITPNEPNTGYGYIKKGEAREHGFDVDSFKEKPNKEKAHEYFQSKNFLWNSGIFLFKASTYLNELSKYRSDIYDACKLSAANASNDMDFIRVEESNFLECPSESIDYAVMEKTKHSIVFPLDAGWSDVGSWSSLWSVSKKDKNGNVLKGDTEIYNSKNSFIQSNDKLITAIGLKDTVVVSTSDAVLIADMNTVDNVKHVVNVLKNNSRNEWEYHREVFRPWGSYDSVDSGDRYQVKRITVNPGAKLSLQKHYHRSEHWVVVSGQAKVTNGEKTFVLSENESTYIPIGTIHSLENPDKDKPLELIEVQSGDYLGEDDIVRYEDIYGRVEQ
jgi:mannose-1-phosphate guanylyltransferase